MTNTETPPRRSGDADVLSGQDRSSWVRLRTLIFLRWIAILGQLIALTVADNVYGLQIELGLCYLIVGISVVANLIAIFIFPENMRLSEGQNFLMLLFDLLQLGALLFLTGGLHNPFALLLVGPVTISAAVLTLRSFLMIGFTGIVIASALSQFYLPLRTDTGMELRIPEVFLFGTWLALMIAIAFLGAYTRRVSTEMNAMSDALSATQQALSREQKLTDLGGVVAAAAHELGTPLATIKLTSSELVEELSENPDLREDAMLIREQADRCRDILRDMGRAGKDDLHMRQAPLSAVVEEAAEPHAGRGVEISYLYTPLSLVTPDQPTIVRQPEVIHGLRNMVQNAVDFANAHVWIEAEWSDEMICIRIADDGPGYPPHLLGRIGDPYMRHRRKQIDKPDASRLGYEGMGLGLFIAKTLLERTGAELIFANGNEEREAGALATGAIVQITWPKDALSDVIAQTPDALGVNQPFSAV